MFRSGTGRHLTRGGARFGTEIQELWCCNRGKNTQDNDHDNQLDQGKPFGIAHISSHKTPNRVE